MLKVSLPTRRRVSFLVNVGIISHKENKLFQLSCKIDRSIFLSFFLSFSFSFRQIPCLEHGRVAIKKRKEAVPLAESSRGREERLEKADGAFKN